MHIFLLGTGGTIDDKMSVGDLILPSRFVLDTDKATSFAFANAATRFATADLATKLPTHKDVTHAWVQTILRETESKIKKLRAAGVSTIDIEGRYMAEALVQNPGLDGGLLLVVSDQPNGQYRYTENNATLLLVKERVRLVLESVLRQP